jgi:Ca2+-binding protein (EF-Hand superfamily)
MNPITEILENDSLLTQITKSIFDAIDSDHSGHIDKKELKATMVQVSQDSGLDPPTDEEVTEALMGLDSDGSGTIDVTEFKELIRQLLEAISY